MLLLLCSIYLAFGAKLSGCGALELGGWCFGWTLIVVRGDWVSDGSVSGGEVSWTVAEKTEVPTVKTTGSLSVLPFLSVARATVVS